MKGRYRAYPEYKDSGVEWLGDVPEHWEAMPFKWQIDCNDGGVWGENPNGENDTLVLRSTEQTVDGFWQIVDPAHRYLLRKDIESALLLDGDLLVTKSSGSSSHIGKTTLVNKSVSALNCCYSNFMQRIRTKTTFIPKLGWYLMNNRLARLQLDLLSNSTTGLANLNGSLIGQIMIPVPPVAEQYQIANFLDHETSKIDTLIEKQQQLVALLKEKRQAVISHAVTKGLNPDAPMKDSGVEWLGEVHESWSVLPIKRILLNIEQGSSPNITNETNKNHKFRVIKISAIKQGHFIEEESKPIESRYFEKKFQINSGDLLLTRGNTPELVADACVVDRKPERLLMLSDLVYRLVCSKSIDEKYLTYCLLSSFGRSQIKSDARGSSMTMAKVSQNHIKSWLITLPPLEEQFKVVEFLNRKEKLFTMLTSRITSTIKLLQERRTALISAAVTGKIDVRNWQPPTDKAIQ